MTQRALVISLILLVSSLPLVVLASSPPGPASGGSNLLQNPGFEKGTQYWSKSPSAATFDVTNAPEYVHGGSRAASLNRTDGVLGEISIYQDVPVLGGQLYSLSGWAYKNDPRFSYVKLRIKWKDAALQTVRDDESHPLTDDDDAYHLLCVPAECDGIGVRAPLNAVTARIGVIAIITSPNPETPIFFDDLSFTFQGSKMYLPLVVKKH